MKAVMHQDIYLQKDDKLIVGFINTNWELEYTEYHPGDGGFILIDETRDYTVEELEDILYEFTEE